MQTLGSPSSEIIVPGPSVGVRGAPRKELFGPVGAGRMAPQDKSGFSRKDGGPWSMRQREAFVLREWLAARTGLTRVHSGHWGPQWGPPD